MNHSAIIITFRPAQSDSIKRRALYFEIFNGRDKNRFSEIEKSFFSVAALLYPSSELIRIAEETSTQSFRTDLVTDCVWFAIFQTRYI